jgi:glycosyltransferase involved in cell wall biosynthesis
LGIEPERVQVVYEGVAPAFRPLPVEDVRQTVRAMGLQPKEYILHVGTLEPRKNLVRLVEAYYQVRQEVSPPVPKLVLAGAAGWSFRQVFERIKALDLSEDVTVLGRVDDLLLPALYNGALLFVYPSLYEGFGLPVLEAMACGIPVITSNISSLPEVAGDAGLVVDPADKQALAEAIGKLIGDQGLREAFSIAGLQRAKLFSWERAARQTLSIYENASQSIN